MLTVQQFQSQFSSEEQGLQYWSAHRWPQGCVCPGGGGGRGYMRAKRVQECRTCGYQGSVTAGTIFHKTSGAAAGLVLGPVPQAPRQERDFGMAIEQGDRGVLPDRVADAAENSQGHGGPR
jgi:hypothetical protein